MNYNQMMAGFPLRPGQFGMSQSFKGFPSMGSPTPTQRQQVRGLTSQSMLSRSMTTNVHGYVTNDQTNQSSVNPIAMTQARSFDYSGTFPNNLDDGTKTMQSASMQSNGLTSNGLQSSGMMPHELQSNGISSNGFQSNGFQPNGFQPINNNGSANFNNVAMSQGNNGMYSPQTSSNGETIS